MSRKWNPLQKTKNEHFENETCTFTADLKCAEAEGPCSNTYMGRLNILGFTAFENERVSHHKGSVLPIIISGLDLWMYAKIKNKRIW